MFKIHDERSAVRRIQTYLHFIKDRTYPSLPYLSIDGIYGEETRLAVAAFQELEGLAVSGNVDIITNDKIYSVYKSGVVEKVENTFSERDFPISIGFGGALAESINRLLFDLRKIYVDIPRADNGSYYGRSTEAAVKAFEEIVGLEPTGAVDVRLYNRMVRETRANNFN